MSHCFHTSIVSPWSGDNDVRYDWGMKETEHLSPHINNIEVFSNADLKLHSDLWYIPGNSKKKKN